MNSAEPVPADAPLSIAQLEENVREIEERVRRTVRLLIRSAWMQTRRSGRLVVESANNTSTATNGRGRVQNQLPAGRTSKSVSPARLQRQKGELAGSDIYQHVQGLDFASKSRVLHRLAVQHAQERIVQRLDTSGASSGAAVNGESRTNRTDRTSRSGSGKPPLARTQSCGTITQGPGGRRVGTNRSLSCDASRHTASTGTRRVKSAGFAAPETSTALVLLRAALPAALSQLFLCKLRLQTRLRREVKEEVALRFQYYCMRRSLRLWQAAAHSQRTHRVILARHTVAWWMAWTQMRRETRCIVARYVAGVRNRLHAFNAHRHRQLTRLFSRWRVRFSERRMAWQMNVDADEFCATHRKSRFISLPIPPREDFEHESRISGGGEVKSRGALDYQSSRRDVMRRAYERASGIDTRSFPGGRISSTAVCGVVFRHWRSRVERRLEVSSANYLRSNTLKGTAFHRWRAATHRTRMRTVPLGAHETRTLTSTRAAKRRVHVDPDVRRGAIAIAPYMQSCAEHLYVGNLLRASVRRWREAWLESVADRYFIFAQRKRVVEKWEERCVAQQTRRRAMHGVFSVWRRRAYVRRTERISHVMLRECALWHAWSTWRNARAASEQYRTQLSRRVFMRWAAALQLRECRAALKEKRMRRALLAWRQQAKLQLHTRTLRYVAETLHELVVQVGCLRRWRRRCVERQRETLSRSILSDICAERQRARCFIVWRTRVKRLQERRAGITTSAHDDGSNV